MPPRNLGNRNPGSERLGDDPPLLLHRPAPAAACPGANAHPPARELRVAYSVAHMCETFPPNQQEDCNIPRASIKVGWENRLRLTSHRHRSIEPFFMSLAARDSEFRRWSGRVDRRICQTFAASPAEPGELPLGFRTLADRDTPVGHGARRFLFGNCGERLHRLGKEERMLHRYGAIEL